MRFRVVMVGLAILVVLPFLSLALLSALSKRPAGLGVRGSQLSDCPDSPNCVCSHAADPTHFIEPFAFTGPPEGAMDQLVAVLSTMPRSKIVTWTDSYLHAEFTSAVFRFVDDVEFLIDPATRRIHVRSASRAGHSDLGVNRRRLEEIRSRFRTQAD